MKKLFILCLLIFLMSGCSNVQETVKKETDNDVASTDSLDDTFYPIVNLDINTQRIDYYASFGRSNDFFTIGRELQLLSTSHFSTSNYYLAEGQYLDSDVQDGFIKRDNDPDKYPYSLQPAKGTSIEGVLEPIMVSCVVEQDYYRKDGNSYVLSGASLAIVLDPMLPSMEELVTPFSDSTMEEYGKQCIEVLYDFLQSYKESKEHIFADIPLNICVYQASSEEGGKNSGKYILSCFCDGSLGTIEKLDYNTVVFTSDTAEKIDLTTSSEFEIFKSNLKNSSTEAIGVVGYGRYKDKELQSLQITLNMNVKTYGELQYLVSLAADDLNSRFSANVDIKVQVNTQDGLAAVILKDKNGSAISSIFD